MTISFSEKIKDHILYPNGVFTKWEAWIDLLLFSEKGEVKGSELHFQKKWNWSRSAVRAFFGVLENKNMIHKEVNGITTIKIDLSYFPESNIKPLNPDVTESPKRKRKSKSMNVNMNGGADEIKAIFKKTMNDVILKDKKMQLYFCSDDYKQAKLFFGYWTEQDASGRMLWQKNKTFEIEGRMNRWMLNDYHPSSGKRTVNDPLAKLKNHINNTLSNG